ncbi:hypothetical protein ALC57_04961 [Trachymyrmex cornetzi]|uniref:CCHC-type domain-containing protein n=1 Tax=Trachymyrmex cornetzi TaxID=471704 RepID=A0A151JBZ0_9HYME|nr:hypothetical protein ALC57_04961 [Trachymyrmex cornetzi]
MDRAQLEEMTLEQLKTEAQKFNISLVEDKYKLIEDILNFIERQKVQTHSAKSAGAHKTTQKAGDTPSSLSPASEQVRQITPDVASLITALTNPMQQLQQQILDSQQAQQTLLQEMLLALTARIVNPPPAQMEQPVTEQESASPRSHTSSQPSQRTTLSTISSSQAITLLASQIPDFGGTESENVQLWIQRIEQVARIHRVPDDVTLLAASSKLTNIARKWYDIGSGSMLESWQGFKEAILKRFTRKILYHIAIQKVENRKWNFSKESFLEYATEKLTLMHNLGLSQESTIHLLISGIGSRSLRELAASLNAASVDDFLEKMHQIASASLEHDKRHDTKSTKKETVHKPGYKSAVNDKQTEKEGPLVCAHCKKPGHHKDKCWRLRRRDQIEQQTTTASTPAPTPSIPVATVSVDEVTEEDSVIAFVQQPNGKNIYIQTLALEVKSLNYVNCNLRALVDTGSPISFVKLSIFNIVKNTPSKLLLGYDQRNHTDSQLTELVNDLARIDVDLETERNTIRDTAHEVTEKLRKYNKKYRDARHKPATKYKVDDLVMIRNLHAKPGQSTKFDVPYKGPYQVTKVLDFDRYVVTDIPGFNLSAKPYKAILSPDKLKPWIRPV